LTKIKIIGNPGKQNIEKLKRWLEDSLKKFNLFPEEIYLIFIGNVRQLEAVYQKHGKRFSSLTPEKRLLLRGIFIRELRTTAYLQEDIRNEKSPPIIMVKKNTRLSEDDILDEVSHMREDKDGWNKIKIEAFTLLLEDYKEIFGRLPEEEMPFILWLRGLLHDFFSSEMMCQYDLISEALSGRKGSLNYWLKVLFPLKGKSKITDLNIVMGAAFLTTLPPAYPPYLRQKDEEKLEEIVINYIRRMSMESEYRKIKSIISKLESPPKVANIYKVGSEIIELAQEFLKK
jgi:DNA-binding transcriptional ArsR family regulator